jgi:hypothetical protein
MKVRITASNLGTYGSLALAGVAMPAYAEGLR